MDVGEDDISLMRCVSHRLGVFLSLRGERLSASEMQGPMLAKVLYAAVKRFYRPQIRDLAQGVSGPVVLAGIGLYGLHLDRRPVYSQILA